MIKKNSFNDAVIHERSMASEQKIKQLSANSELKKYRIIHFAAHGVSSSINPAISALVLAQNDNNTSMNDGYLTKKEIEKLKIHADFVNLSACQTGMGKLYRGEGVVGLSDAFFIAGANSLSITLWNINEYSTMDFMVSMYKEFIENGGDFSAAISEVKRNFLNEKITSPNQILDYKNPCFWAPFIYYGNYY